MYPVASEQYGYITTAAAKDLGIPAVELGKLAHRGKLERLGYGLYRFPDFPSSDRDPFMAAVLSGGQGAVLSHDAALALHDLAYVNPTELTVSVPRQVRRTPLPGVRLVHNVVDAAHRTMYFAIPSTTVARALLDCRSLVMASRLRAAADAARESGLLLRTEYKSVLAALAA